MEYRKVYMEGTAIDGWRPLILLDGEEQPTVRAFYWPALMTLSVDARAAYGGTSKALGSTRPELHARVLARRDMYERLGVPFDRKEVAEVLRVLQPIRERPRRMVIEVDNAQVARVRERPRVLAMPVRARERSR